MYKSLISIFTIGVLITCLSMVSNASSIGIGLSQGVEGELEIASQGEFETDKWDLEYTFTGLDFYDARLTAAYRFETGVVDFTVFQENDWAGYTIGNLNRTNDIGISAILPFVGTEIEIALFGRNGNTAGPVRKYDPDTGDIVSVTPGLTPIDGTHPNLSIATHFDVYGAEIEVKLLSNIADEPTQQGLIDASYSTDIGPLQATLSALYRGQKPFESDIQHEVSGMLTFGLDW